MWVSNPPLISSPFFIFFLISEASCPHESGLKHHLFKLITKKTSSCVRQLSHNDTEPHHSSLCSYWIWRGRPMSCRIPPRVWEWWGAAIWNGSGVHGGLERAEHEVQCSNVLLTHLGNFVFQAAQASFIQMVATPRKEFNIVFFISYGFTILNLPQIKAIIC